MTESFTFKERTLTQWNVVRFPLYALWIQKATLYLQHIFRMTKISLFCVMPCFRVGKARCDIADDMTQRGHYKNSSLGRSFVQHRADAPEYEIKEESRWVERVFESWETSFRVIPPINEVYQVFCQNSQILVHRHIPCMGPDNDGEVFHNHADLNGGHLHLITWKRALHFILASICNGLLFGNIFFTGISFYEYSWLAVRVMFCSVVYSTLFDWCCLIDSGRIEPTACEKLLKCS